MRYTAKKISESFTVRRMSVAMAVLLLGIFCLLPRVGTAQVAGACVNCHTMHNSQGGTSMNPGATATVYRSLTKGDCVGCHTGGPVDLTDNNIPKVNHTSAPTAGTLAGGSFGWMGTGGATTDAKGHNVAGISINADIALGITPPGGSPLAGRMTCAGTNGCHGSRAVADEYADISGSHHAPKLTANIADGTSLAKSYRFLNTIQGIEDPTWEKDAGHNQYYGKARTLASDTAPGTISSLCGQCHGAFHAAATTDPTAGTGISYTANMGSPWVRHPTDFDMTAVAKDEYRGYATYRKDVPVASSSLTAVTDVTTAGNAIVTCISCHRAHGSDQADLLRWDYTTMNAHAGENTTGCFACHTTKDA